MSVIVHKDVGRGKEKLGINKCIEVIRVGCCESHLRKTARLLGFDHQLMKINAIEYSIQSTVKLRVG